MARGCWQWSRARRSLPGRVASVLLVFTALPSIDAALGVMLARAAAGAPLAESGKGAHCPTAETLAALAGEPSARWFATIDTGPALLIRWEERRGGKEGGSTCRYRRMTDNEKKKRKR